MGFLARVKDTVLGLVRSKSVSLVSDSVVEWSNFSGPSPVNTFRNSRRWVQTYKANSLLGSVIGRIAEDVAKGQYRLYRMMGEADDGSMMLKVVHRHPMWDLWTDPNPDMTGHEYRKLGIEWLETCGIWLSWIERDDNGTPIGLWPIEPWKILRRPTYSRPYWLIIWKEETMVAAPWDVVYIRYIDPEHPYRLEGASPAARVAPEIATSEYATQWNLNSFRNSSNPGKMVGLPTSKETAEAFKAHYEANYTGNKNSHKTVFVGTGADGKGQLQIVDLMRSQKDVEYNKGMLAWRNRVCQNWNMSPVILGDAGDSANGDIGAEVQLYQEFCIDQRQSFVVDQFNKQLVGEFDDPSLVMGYITPVRESKQFELQKGNDGLTRGGITIDEYRKSRGEDPLGGPLGESITMPANTILVNKNMTPEEVQAMLLERAGKTAPPVAGAPSTPTSPTPISAPKHVVSLGGQRYNGRLAK